METELKLCKFSSRQTIHLDATVYKLSLSFTNPIFLLVLCQGTPIMTLMHKGMPSRLCLLHGW